MKTRKILLSFFIIGVYVGKGQELPQNPEPGKCYVRCVTPDVYTTEKQKVIIKPAYSEIIAHPSEFQSVNEKVTLKEKYIKLEVVPAEFEWLTVPFLSKDESHKLIPVEAKFINDVDFIEIKGATSRWEMGEKIPNCYSSDPKDCRTWYYKDYPPEYEGFAVEKVYIDGHSISTDIPGEKGSYRKKIIKAPAYIKEVMVPAEYRTITKSVLVKDAWEEKVVVAEVAKVITNEVLTEQGGSVFWKEVDCSLTNYNIIPIIYNLNSANLTKTAKEIIDELLIPILDQDKNISIELASHTDARGNSDSNQNLSDRRAQSVVNYIVNKGISRSRLVPVGYGETKLKNRCSDGVPCTEMEHMENRRTEFRVINR